jgi:RHS repeat-associated protein
VLASLATTGLALKKSGYLYIWVSNETPNWDVFFDNLSVTHYSGPLLEETHYYPFGLTMAGISSKALKPYYAENKYRYNKGSELQDKDFTDGSGLELYDTHFRKLDPQLGRWWQIDPKIENDQESTSPYSSMANNPINYNDPNGDCIPCVVVGLEAAGEILTAAVAGAVAYIVGSEVSKKAPTTIEFDPAKTSGPLLMSSFGSSSLGDIAGTNGAQAQKAEDKKAQTAPGQTAAGHPTDVHGNKLGPSGKPQINTVKHLSQKSAKDAARAEGKGAPVKHTNPKKGEDHYHPTDKDGNKIPNSTHHEY